MGQKQIISSKEYDSGVGIMIDLRDLMQKKTGRIYIYIYMKGY